MRINAPYAAEWKFSSPAMKGPHATLMIWTFYAEIWTNENGFYWELTRLSDRVAHGDSLDICDAQDAVEDRIREIMAAMHKEMENR
ncbi:hypothetical protein CJ179_38560 [Rhodococcus sp. ACS1]|uniref:hypothetical protein n=1 Tax=Rhodococcus sp. ACS1 TaxID=2028570 RepID=UPI000BB0E498|nr:hypothetical protein [Rhodococcus sp. ACS1]PBC38503.1 hypothetical protein CJ179_38560 [Rhodococcus sp. ACS1]